MTNTTHIGTLHTKPECREAMIESFKMISQAPGYISHTCYIESEDENKILLVEEWESKEAHMNFVQSMPEESMKNWLNMLTKPPEDAYFDKLE